MNIADYIFKNSIIEILDNGIYDENPRPHWADGTPAHTKFVTQMFECYNIAQGEFPITTLRPIAWKNAIKEILWIYQDQSNSLDLLRDKYGIKWWDEWDIGDRTIGQRYGATVKRHNLIDNLINGLKNNPYGRRHIMNMFQYDDFKEKGGLDPCCYETLWSVRGIFLDCTLTIRSSDYLMAGHVNRIQYVALQMMIAKAVGLNPGKFAVITQNMHIYDRHISAAEELLKRKPSPHNPYLIFNPESDNFYSFTIDDFDMINYDPAQPQIKLEIAI